MKKIALIIILMIISLLSLIIFCYSISLLEINVMGTSLRIINLTRSNAYAISISFMVLTLSTNILKNILFNS